MLRLFRGRRLGVGACLALAACQGQVVGESVPAPISDSPTIPDPIAPQTCTAPAVGFPALVRLSPEEYANTAADLVGAEPSIGSFLRTVDAYGFIGTSSEVSDSVEVDAYLSAAEQLSALALETLPELADKVALSDPEVVRSFVSRFGARVLRRPLDAADVQRYLAVYQTVLPLADGVTAVDWMLRALFGSPSFIYRVERLAQDDLAGGVVPLGPYERASRLSYTLTGSMPDDQLFVAAANGELAATEGVRAQAERLVASERGKQRLARFFLEWLGLRSTDDSRMARLELFAADQPDIAEQLSGSLNAFVGSVASRPDATLADLLTAPSSWATPALAQVWGLPAPEGQAFQLLSSTEPRPGVLTHPAVLAVHSSDGFANATLRGKFVLEKLLCEHAPEPNPNVLEMFPDIVAPLATDRMTLQQLHAKNPACAGCHSVMDPLGFAFESYDAAGRYRTSQENIPGQPAPIDASGTVALDGEEHPYKDAGELVALLAASRSVQVCLQKQAFRYSLRRLEGADDGCSLSRAFAGFEARGFQMSELFVALATTDAFLYTRSN